MMESDFSNPIIKKMIRKEIQQIKKISRIVNKDQDAKKAASELDTLYGTINKLNKKNADFMNKVHENGLSSREIARKLIQDKTKIRLHAALKTAYAAYSKSEVASRGPLLNYVQEAFTNDPEVAAVLPF